MLFLKRLLTALVLLGLLFFVVRTAALTVGGGIAGAKATSAQPTHATDFKSGLNEGMVIGARAGIAFRQEYGQIIGLSSLGLASVIALWLSFGGVLSWCREQTPPPLPLGRYRPGQ